ncbi:MAG: squalene/phytoene synthase family protein [candidate division Zixibacteria bacterium]
MNPNKYNLNLAQKGTPHLFLAANFLKPELKFHAFLAAYAAMRIIDDLVDDWKTSGYFGSGQSDNVLREIKKYSRMFGNKEFDGSSHQGKELHELMEKCKIPQWPFVELARSMEFDVYHNRFESMDQFLNYAEGAAVAPGAVFMHLAGCRYIEKDNDLIAPSFDIKQAARPLALFSYLVHIIRDFKKDFTFGKEPLIYIDRETARKFNLGKNDYSEIISSNIQNDNFTEMIEWYIEKISEYRDEAEKKLNEISNELPDDGRFSLNFILDLYFAIVKKIHSGKFQILNDDLNLQPGEIIETARHTSERLKISTAPILEKLTDLLK